MNHHGKRHQGKIVNDKGQFIPDIIAMGWRIPPSVLPAVQFLFSVSMAEPVQVQYDRGRIDEERGLSPGILGREGRF
jgi:hypothetical protein